MIKSNEYLNLEKLIQKYEITTYHSRNIAKRYAVKRGWNKKDTLLIQRDFDKQWLIARVKGDCLECLLWNDIGSVKLRREDV